MVTENPTPTTVVHCSKAKFDIYIGRKNPRFPHGSIWGNPFEIGKHGTRSKVIADYRSWIVTQPHLLAQLSSIKGKVLGCWCHPDSCHGDVLAALADGLPITPTQAALF
jgi:hypothetical protein